AEVRDSRLQRSRRRSWPVESRLVPGTVNKQQHLVHSRLSERLVLALRGHPILLATFFERLLRLERRVRGRGASRRSAPSSGPPRTRPSAERDRPGTHTSHPPETASRPTPPTRRPCR